jgi:hypothetical protein
MRPWSPASLPRAVVLLGGVVASAAIGVYADFAARSRADALSTPPARVRPLHTPLYGLTVDDLGNLPQLVQTLRRLPHRPTTRIYFDARAPAQYYARAVRVMHPVSYLMGELLDSSDESRIGTAAFSSRIRSYLSALGGQIDVWEIGNEVNGNWLGPYPTVETKLIAAYEQVSAAHRRTALTLYYNIGCGDGAGELDPIAFSRRFVPERVRNGLDFVLLSYYEQNCRQIRPSASTWTNYFSRLHALYPHARVGFGEIGLTNPVSNSTLSYAEGMIRYYYGMAIRLPYYAAGYFWWYCDEDCVPYSSKPLFAALRSGFTDEASALRPRR